MKLNRFLFLLLALVITACDFHAARLKVLKRIDPRIVEEGDTRDPVEIRRSYALLKGRNLRLAHTQALLKGASHTLRTAEKKVHRDYSAVIAKIDDVQRDVDALIQESEATPAH